MISLVIGNKNYSSWSMRPWVLLKALDIPFQEVVLKFHSPEWDQHIANYSPSKQVPVLWDGEVGNSHSICVWESNAIYEYLAEQFPEKHLWPQDKTARAQPENGLQATVTLTKVLAICNQGLSRSRKSFIFGV